MPRLKKLRERKSAFTLVEILVVIAIIAILAAVVFVVINPVQRINQSNDARAREEVLAILDAINLYGVDNSGAMPTADGDPLPTVTAANIMTAGVDATLLDNMSTYLPTIPDNGYKVGRLASGSPIVGATLSDSTVYTKTN